MGCTASKSVSNGRFADNLKSTVMFEAKGDPNSRCFAMLREATDLYNKLLKAQKDIRTLSKAAQVTLDTGNTVLNAPLPYVYPSKEAVTHSIVDQHEAIGGRDYSSDMLAKVKTDMVVNLQAEAFAPLDAWEARYLDAYNKQKLVNKAYDHMITARTKATNAKDHADKMGGKHPAQDHKVIEAQRKLQQLQDAYTVACNQHAEEEDAQYQRLVSLNKDAASFQSVIRQALGETGAALTAACEVIPDEQVVAPAISNAPEDAAAAASAAAQAAAAAAHAHAVIAA